MALWDSILGPGGIGALGFGQLPGAASGMPSYTQSAFNQLGPRGPGALGMGQLPQMPAQTPGVQPAGGNDMMNMAMKLMQMGQPHALGQQPGQAAPGVMPPMGGPQQPSQFGSPAQYIAQMMQGRALGTQPSGNLWAELMRRQGYGM